MSDEDRDAYVAQKQPERRELSAQMKELVAKRDDYVAEAKKNEPSSAPAFDTEVSRLLTEQLK